MDSARTHALGRQKDDVMNQLLARAPTREYPLLLRRLGRVHELAHEQSRLPDGEPATDHGAGDGRLVATWQRRNEHRRPWREQAQSNVRLNTCIERFDEYETPAYPTL